MLSQKGFSMNTPGLATRLREAASRPATLAAAVSDRALSASSKATDTERRPVGFQKLSMQSGTHTFTPKDLRQDRKLQTEASAFASLRRKQSTFLSLPPGSEPSHRASRHLTVHTRRDPCPATLATTLKHRQPPSAQRKPGAA